MKKRPSSVSQPQVHRSPRRWMLRFVPCFFCLLVLLLLLWLYLQIRVEFFLRSSMQVYSGKPKVAFLFITRTGLPLDFLWQEFFKRAEEPNFSIYIHARPGFKFNERTTKCTFCYGRELKDSIQVGWGEATMIQAERLVFKKALEDPSNQRFILLSDSCVPLYNFSYIYNYVMSSPRSFVDSFVDPKGGRYNPKMFPVIPKSKWRKGSQWVTLIRKHAESIVLDNKIFPVFKRHCKRRPSLPPHLRKYPNPGIVQKEHNCIPDEHYVQTLLNMMGLNEELERRTLTYTVWKESFSTVDTQAWHPITFSNDVVNAIFIAKLRGIDHVNYNTEYRTEWCSVRGEPSPCFLFARKFTRGTAAKVLQYVILNSDSMQEAATKRLSP